MLKINIERNFVDMIIMFAVAFFSAIIALLITEIIETIPNYPFFTLGLLCIIFVLVITKLYTIRDQKTIFFNLFSKKKQEKLKNADEFKQYVHNKVRSNKIIAGFIFLLELILVGSAFLYFPQYLKHLILAYGIIGTFLVSVIGIMSVESIINLSCSGFDYSIDKADNFIRTRFYTTIGALSLLLSLVMQVYFI